MKLEQITPAIVEKFIKTANCARLMIAEQNLNSLLDKFIYSSMLYEDMLRDELNEHLRTRISKRAEINKLRIAKARQFKQMIINEQYHRADLNGTGYRQDE